jgi:hypothetical protein
VRNGLQNPLPSSAAFLGFRFINNRETDQAAPRAPDARPVQDESTRSDAPDSGKKPRADRPRRRTRSPDGAVTSPNSFTLARERGGCAPSPGRSGRTTRFAELTSRGVTLPRNPPQAARSLEARNSPRSGDHLPECRLRCVWVPSLVLRKPSIQRTAEYGAVCPVVWEGRRRREGFLI